ncbi:MAG: hypothetical protein J6333_12875 [Planctomycetes bacterium]|nr:hypothetical protein [Planctomycetota bacterium]
MRKCISLLLFFTMPFITVLSHADEKAYSERVLSLKLNIPMELSGVQCVYFNLLDENHKLVEDYVRVNVGEKPTLEISPAMERGYIASKTFPPTVKADKALFVGLKDPVAFSPETKLLNLDLQYYKPVKFVISIKQPKADPIPDGIRVYDVTGREQVELADNIGLPSRKDLKLDSNRKVVFYGLPRHVYCLAWRHGDEYEWIEIRSPNYMADGTKEELQADWIFPSRQIVNVTIVAAEGNKRNRARDIESIRINGSRWVVKDGATHFNTADKRAKLQRFNNIVTFKIDNDSDSHSKGYTKILSGETLKITPETKEHTVVLTKEQVDGEITFAVTDAASGVALPANLYYAPIGKEGEPLFAPGDKPLALAPGKYQVAVFAPGYDCLPLTLEVKKKEKRAIPCKLAKSRAVAVSVKYSGETGPNGAIPGIYSVNSPAAPLFAQMKENPLATEFSVPFDPRLGSSLFVIASGCAPRLVPLDAKTPEKLEITLDKGVTVKGTFSAEYAAHAREQAKKALSSRPFPPDAELIDARPMTLLFFPEDNHYVWAGGAKAQPGEPWTAQLVPGKYRMALDFGDVYLRLPGKLTVPDAGEMAFPPELLSAKDELKPVVGQARTCANDLFRRLAKK